SPHHGPDLPARAPRDRALLHDLQGARRQEDADAGLGPPDGGARSRRQEPQELLGEPGLVATACRWHGVALVEWASGLPCRHSWRHSWIFDISYWLLGYGYCGVTRI